MGSAVGKPKGPLNVHLECDSDHTDIATDARKTKAIKVANEFSVPTNTLVSKKKLVLSENVKVKISCSGGGVIRVGLTAKDPAENENILEASVFEKEEGFCQEESSRTLYKTEFNGYCYGPPGAEIEYECERKETDVWLYVIYVYGVPVVKAELIENDDVDGDEIILCSIIKGQDSKGTIVANTAVCRISEPVVNENVYHCRWNMKLENENIAGKSPTYGYMCLKLVSRKKNKGEIEEDTIWERKSAVQEYPFSSVIAFRLSILERQVSHNLFVNSVGNTTKDFLKDNVKPGSLYFVIELSSGQVEVIHGKGLLIAQELGSTLLVTGYKCDDREASTNDILIEISAKINFQPRRIQFGESPVNFVLEFNERLTDKDVTDIKHDLECPVKRLQETNTVQVLINENDETDEDDIKFDIEVHFSREKTGGGRIDSIKKDKDIPGCWMVRFKSTEIARKVWMMKTHSVTIGEERVQARVFPVYEGLGLAVNNGEKPVHDETPLVVDVDKSKLRFIRTRELEKKSFLDSINRKIQVDVVWAAFSNDNKCDGFEAEFEHAKDVENDVTEPNSITFKCQVPESEWKRLAVWKDITKKEVLSYFSKSIHHVMFNVEDDAIDNVLATLNSLQEKNEFEFEENPESKKVTLFGSDYQVLKNVAEKAGKRIVIPENVTKQVKITVEKYLALDTEGVLDKVKNECPYTSFKVNREAETVSLRGPTDEVQDANRKILQLAVNTTTVQLHIKEEEAKFMRKVEGGKYLIKEELRKKRMNSNFTLSNTKNTLSVIIYTGNGIDEEKKKKEMLGVIENAIRTCFVNVEKEPPDTFKSYDWKNYKHEIEKRAGGQVIILDPKSKPIITIIGTAETSKFGKVEVENYLKLHKRGTVILRVPIEIAEYLDEFKNENYRDKLECVKDSNGCHTGELSIHGVANEISRLEDAIQKEIKKISQHWFYMKKSWIASVIQDLVDLKTLSHNERFLLQLDIGHSLAAQGITGVAIAPKSGTIIQVRQGDITFETTAAIVHSTNGHKSTFERGLGKCLIDVGGSVIKDELFQNITYQDTPIKRTDQEQHEAQFDKIADSIAGKETQHTADGNAYSKFKTGDAIVTVSGRLRCLKIVHVFPPKWIDGSKSEDKNLKTLVKKILQICQDQQLSSVALSAMGCGAGKYPIEKTKNLVIKELVLCDSSKIVVEKFTEALETLKVPWFVFKHGKQIQVEDFISSSRRKAERQVAVRPNSSHKGTRPLSALSAQLKWGRQQTHIYKDESTQQHSGQTKAEIVDIFKDGLPYSIPITEKLTLHVKKGDLTQQLVNVIVCPTPEFPNLTGEIANAVTKAGGNTILQECKNHGAISEGHVQTTGAGRLKCDRIYHACIPKKWNSDNGEEFVCTLVSSCLTEAINNSFSTVAFPTIGTGRSGFPADRVANAMIKSICQIGNNFRNSPLTDVTIVVYSMSEGICKIFEEAVPLLFKTSGSNNMTGMTISRKGSRSLPRRKTVKYVPPPSFDKHTHVDDVVIVKIVSKTNGKTIQKMLEDIVDKEIITKKLNYQELSKEQTLSESEESSIKTLELKYGVNIEIDRSSRCVKLTGLRTRVDNCEFEAVKLLEDEFPRWRLREKNIRAVAHTVQWYFGDDGGESYPVDAASNYEIHTHFHDGQDFIYHNHRENKKYKMVINDMMEHPIDDPKKRRRLYLRTNIDKDITLPDDWSIAVKGIESAQIKLNENGTEFNEVKNKFIKDGCKPNTIVSITRLENKFLWLQYQTKKRQLEKQNPKIQNEKCLWHGTDSDSVPKVIKNGYDRSFTRVHLYGKGAYFATTSSYSDGYARPDTNGIKKMFLNRVLVGVPCVSGDSNMAVLPVRNDLTVDNFKVHYDSAVNTLQNPAMYVIFHDTQAYPEYLIAYN
ncbi:uncharacterized protein LOC123536374 isoform X2 [Mercenaria mercenaria]|uniref:uncharacterized protein LOC123536374 isoform X2 n=1 Tax=Mercenaria mercenaria TaxID=6596 RepID=UPI00234F0562|nr:uncharacterized protein LOC123536374 isoform X2 [Mercenaria mercenaria]